MIVALVGLLVAGSPDAGVARRDKGLLYRPAKNAQELEEQKALVEYELDHPPDAGTPPPPFRWKISNIIQDMPIDGPQVANDVPVKLHSLLVKGRREDVMLEILDHFRASGLYVQKFSEQAQLTQQLQITALDEQRALTYTAMVDGLANGTCMVVLGEANIGMASYAGLARKAKNEEVKYFLPLMPGAIAPFRTDVEQMHSISFSVASDEATAKKFYAKELKQRGYTELDPSLYRKGSDEVMLTMKRDKGRLDVLLTMRAAGARP